MKNIFIKIPPSPLNAAHWSFNLLITWRQNARGFHQNNHAKWMATPPAHLLNMNYSFVATAWTHIYILYEGLRCSARPFQWISVFIVPSWFFVSYKFFQLLTLFTQLILFAWKNILLLFRIFHICETMIYRKSRAQDCVSSDFRCQFITVGTRNPTRILRASQSMKQPAVKLQYPPKYGISFSFTVKYQDRT